MRRFFFGGSRFFFRFLRLAILSLQGLVIWYLVTQAAQLPTALFDHDGGDLDPVAWAAALAGAVPLRDRDEARWLVDELERVGIGDAWLVVDAATLAARLPG